MSLAFQLYAIDPAELDRLLADPEALVAHFDARYITDTPGEAVWLDKSGMGILEALGVMLDPDVTKPAAWVIGKGGLPSSEYPGGYVDPASVEQVAAFLADIDDATFETMASANVMDTDVEYLSNYFPKLRAFYEAAAQNGRAVVTSPVG